MNTARDLTPQAVKIANNPDIWLDRFEGLWSVSCQDFDCPFDVLFSDLPLARARALNHHRTHIAEDKP